MGRLVLLRKKIIKREIDYLFFKRELYTWNEERLKRCSWIDPFNPLSALVDPDLFKKELRVSSLS